MAGGLVFCLSCDTLAGRAQTPGGIIYDSAHWIIVMRAKPLLIAGPAFLILKRHCENFNDLTRDELHAMSDTMQLISRAYQPVLHPEKVHFGLYGEGVKHIHLHVLPRTADLPPGNIPIRYLQRWKKLLVALHLARPISDEKVADVADQLRAALERLNPV